MDLKLVRNDYRADGVTSTLYDEDGNVIARTMEHAYLNDGFYDPKIPDGVYQCLRGLHKLHVDSEPFESFEVMDVEGHDGLLFHVGNFNSDSNGCILLGLSIGEVGGQKALINSKLAFSKFMELQEGCDEFILTVRSP